MLRRKTALHGGIEAGSSGWTGYKSWLRQYNYQARSKGIGQGPSIKACHDTARMYSGGSGTQRKGKFKEMPNPGLKLDDFRDLFRKPNLQKRKLYPFRWDWHLRMFLISLLPPCAILVFTEFIDRYMATDPDIVQIMQDTRANQRKPKDDDAAAEGMFFTKLLEKRISSLEKQIAEMKAKRENDLRESRNNFNTDTDLQETGIGQDVARARLLAGQMIRHNPAGR